MSTQTITAIVANPRHAGRYAIVVDGKTYATLGIDALERLQLAVGGSVEGRGDAIADEAAALHTYDRALNMLAARARSSRELERLLVRKGEEPRHVRAAIDRLQAAGFLDDAAFARQVARSRLSGGGRSARRVRQELARKGVERSVADESVRDVVDDEGIDERALAVAAAEKKLRALRGLEPDVRRRRLYAFLARRGFAPDAIRHATDHLGEALSAGVDAEDQGEA